MPICSANPWAKLLVADQPHADGDLAEHFAGPLLLLLQDRLHAVFGEEAEVDQNLTDASNCHDDFPVVAVRQAFSLMVRSG